MLRAQLVGAESLVGGLAQPVTVRRSSCCLISLCLSFLTFKTGVLPAPAPRVIARIRGAAKPAEGRAQLLVCQAELQGPACHCHVPLIYTAGA